MNISPVNSTSFGYGYYGKKGPILEDVYYGYNNALKDSDVIYIKDKNGKVHPVIVGNLRTLAIQEKHPHYRFMFPDRAVVERNEVEGSIREVTAGDIRKEFAREECIAQKEGRTPRRINYSV